MQRSSKQLRLLQFVEAMQAAAGAYDSMHITTKAEIERRLPTLGAYLLQVADGLATGVCDALEAEGRRMMNRDCA